MHTPIEDVLATSMGEILAVSGMVAIGIGECDGDPCLWVFAEQETEQVVAAVPETLSGYVVVIQCDGSANARDQ